MRISDMRNLGPQMEMWLAELDIDDDDDLRQIGAVDAWRRLRFRFGGQVTVTALYAMAAALSGCHWRDLSMAERARLQRAVDEATLKPGSPPDRPAAARRRSR